MYVEYDKDIEITLSSRIQDTYYIKLPGLDNNNKDYPFSTLCSSKQTNPETEWPQVLGLRTDSRLRLITDLSSYECLWRFMPVLEYVDLRMEAEELLIPEDQGIRRENRKLQRKELIDITASCLSGNKAEYRKDFTTQATYFSTFRFVNMTGLQFINSESVQASKGFSEINHESSTNFQSYTNAISVHGGVSFFGFSAGGGFEHSNTRGSYHESGKQLGRYGDITVTKGREEITTENRETGFEISAQRTDISSHSLALYHDCKPKARKVKFSGVASHYIEDEISNRILKARLTATMSRERSDGQIVAKQPVSAAVIEHIIKKLGYQSNMLITSRGEKSDDLGQVSSFIEVYIPIESTIGINRVETDINVEEVFDEGSRPISKDEL